MPHILKEPMNEKENNRDSGIGADFPKTYSNDFDSKTDYR